MYDGCESPKNLQRYAGLDSKGNELVQKIVRLGSRAPTAAHTDQRVPLLVSQVQSHALSLATRPFRSSGISQRRNNTSVQSD